MIRSATIPTRMSLISFFKHVLFVVKVRGESMLPVLVPGKSYWASGLLPVRKGSIVVLQHANGEPAHMVKRVRACYRGGYAVESAASWGVSGETIGIVPRSAVQGVLFGV